MPIGLIGLSAVFILMWITDLVTDIFKHREKMAQYKSENQQK